MRRTVFALLVCAVTLAGATSAQAAVQNNPEFNFSPWTKAQAGAGNAVIVTFVWRPSIFSGNPSQDRQELVVTTEGLGATTYTAGSTIASFPIITSNGRNLTVDVFACQAADCTSGNSLFSGPKTTRVDGTPPAGTVQVNGGAAATNNRTVALAVAAEDPLIEGIPGSSSGITQAAVDADGDGTFPCDLFIIIGGGTGDTSGCAQPFAATLSTTVPAGDGVKSVGVKFGDGARQNTAPCATGIFCGNLLGSPIFGNESAVATDTILLDTAKPLAIATQSRFTVTRGQAVQFDALASTETGTPAAQSGLDLAASTWSFSDGTPNATGATVSHTYATTGTFVGALRVRDSAGNLSDPRPFSVTVEPPPGNQAGTGSIAGVSGTASFQLTRLAVKGRYDRSALKGSLSLAGSSSAAGPLRVQLRRGAAKKIIATLRTNLPASAFTRALSLPAGLAPGVYRVSLVGPGGTLSARLTLRAPREGVVAARRVTFAGGTARARFTFVARPVKVLRGALSVRWTLAGRPLATVAAAGGKVVVVSLPRGLAIGSGRLVATLIAGTKVVATAQARVR